MNCNWWKGHNFGKWEVVCEQEVLRCRDNALVGRSLTQKRVCEDCGFTQLNKQVVTV